MTLATVESWEASADAYEMTAAVVAEATAVVDAVELDDSSVEGQKLTGAAAAEASAVVDAMALEDVVADDET